MIPRYFIKPHEIPDDPEVQQQMFETIYTSNFDRDVKKIAGNSLYGAINEKNW